MELHNNTIQMKNYIYIYIYLSRLPWRTMKGMDDEIGTRVKAMVMMMSLKMSGDDE
ncbi:hypothetical protein HYC85_020418 [Camellia sinensis]|uniref:Uncharacterized protein n=1 Tax=Camellia sinensis TaxID=4442 RepID=A0A7J7GTE3_CAMSI|nr:hypothetical protein HYC85_020418 [Camellia sinensis]